MAKVVFTTNVQRHVECPQAQAAGATVREVLDYLNDDLHVDQMQISPAYAYEKAPDQDHFLGVTDTRRLFAEALTGARRPRCRLDHSPLFLSLLHL